jgi:hypothetical protein
MTNNEVASFEGLNAGEKKTVCGVYEFRQKRRDPDVV